MEKLQITEALQRRRGNRKLAAQDLGIHVCTLYRKIKMLSVETGDLDGRGLRR
jgi:transcriptional regulator with PAS, ATPase and Fis domain